MSETNYNPLLKMMASALDEEKLYRFMVTRGVDAQTARLAAQQCQKAALRNGAGASLVGGIIGAAATSPAGGLGMFGGAALGLGVGVGGTLLFSEQCEQVQNAAFGLSQIRRLSAGE